MAALEPLLLKEAKLLEFQAELRAWIKRKGLDQQSASPGKFAAEGRQSMPCELAPFFDRLSSRMALSLGDRQTLLAAASAPRYAQKDECLVEQGEEDSALFILCSGMVHAIRSLSDGKQQIVAVFVAGDTLNSGGLFFRPSEDVDLRSHPGDLPVGSL